MSAVDTPRGPDASAVPTGEARDLTRLVARLRAVLGPAAVLTDRQELRTYECDGLTHYKAIPAVVVLPVNADQLAQVVRACAQEGVPYVARGAGTGLSGGALPRADGVLIVTSRLNRIEEVDVENQ